MMNINAIQSALTAIEYSKDLTQADWVLIKALPFIGIGVVLGGLAILAIVLSQFYRLAGKDAKPAPEPAPAPAPKAAEPAAKPAETASEESELEQIAAMIGLSIYMTETSDKVYLTQIPQYYNNNPWTSESLAKQARRFKRWQAVRK